MPFTDFNEFTGFPVIDVWIDHQSAVRSGVVTWNNIDALINFLFPSDGSPPASFDANYPALKAIHLHVEPLVGPQTKTTTAPSLDIADVNEYTSARVTIEYEVSSRLYEVEDDITETDDPVLRLRHNWSGGGEFLTLENAGFAWCDGDALPDEVTMGLLVPTIEQQITWPRVVSPPFGTIRDTIGRVNDKDLVLQTGTAFPETLLLLGAELQRDVLSDGSLGWEMTYRFSERRVKAEDTGCATSGVTGHANVGGWNHFYRSEDESSAGANDAKVGFFRIEGKIAYTGSGAYIGSNHPPYEPVDFDAIFVEDPV